MIPIITKRSYNPTTSSDTINVINDPDQRKRKEEFFWDIIKVSIGSKGYKRVALYIESLVMGKCFSLLSHKKRNMSPREDATLIIRDRLGRQTFIIIDEKGVSSIGRKVPKINHFSQS